MACPVFGHASMRRCVERLPYAVSAVARGLHERSRELRRKVRIVSNRDDHPVALSKGDTVCSTTTSPSIVPRGLPRTSLRETMGTDVTRSASLAMTSARTAAHDPTLLGAALEEIEARRVALEWLLAADLLRLCLV